MFENAAGRMILYPKGEIQMNPMELVVLPGTG